MNAREGIDPAVSSILSAARRRESPGSGPIDVDARSLERAIGEAEAAGRVPVIAEVKRTSPTTEGTRTGDPVAIAHAMERAGAAAISVLTEPTHFDGRPEDLRAIRDAVSIPVLRKDFVLEPDHLDVVPADMILLIARFLDEDLDRLVEETRRRGMQALVEVHTPAELQRAVDAGARIIGINNRDLAELTVDLETFERVAPAAPEHVMLVAESGIATPADVQRMRTAGADALLVGSAIMAGDIEERTTGLVEAER